MAKADDPRVESGKSIRRGYCPVDAINPADGRKWQVLLSNEHMDYIAARGIGAAMELAHTVRWTLLNPHAIFRGVRDDQKELDEDGWLCYVATPDHAYDYKTGNRRPAWEGEVFTVYVTDENVIYGSRWYEADRSDHRLPEDYGDRFSKRLI